MPLFGQQTGEVFIRNYDQGIVETMNGTVRIIDDQKNYFIDIPACTPSAVPVIFLNPEQVFEAKIYPSFVMARTAVFPALQRWHSAGQMEYIVGLVSGGISEVSGIDGSVVSGYNQIEAKAQAIPFDLTYDISCFARYEREAIPMMKHLLRVWQPYSKLRVVDTLGQTRVYSVYNENDVADIGEIVDVADRMKGYTITVRVEGELDINDPWVRATVLEQVTRTGVL